MTGRPGYTDRLHGLYAITDQDLIPESGFKHAVEAVLMGGARIIQYRDKSTESGKRHLQATCCKLLCQQYDATFIVNDDIELCKAVGADGVHLGRDDTGLHSARQQLGDDAIIGVSCYDDIQRAVKAQDRGADYVAFGAMFSSSTKPETVIAGPGIIPDAKQRIEIPVCTIGGIDTGNAQQVVDCGADMIAVISTLFASKNIKDTANKLSGLFAQD